MVLNEMISLMPLQGWISPLNDFFVFWGFFFRFCCCCFETESHCRGQDDLELTLSTSLDSKLTLITLFLPFEMLRLKVCDIMPS